MPASVLWRGIIGSINLQMLLMVLGWCGKPQNRSWRLPRHAPAAIGFFPPAILTVIFCIIFKLSSNSKKTQNRIRSRKKNAWEGAFFPEVIMPDLLKVSNLGLAMTPWSLNMDNVICTHKGRAYINVQKHMHSHAFSQKMCSYNFRIHTNGKFKYMKINNVHTKTLMCFTHEHEHMHICYIHVHIYMYTCVSVVCMYCCWWPSWISAFVHLVMSPITPLLSYLRHGPPWKEQQPITLHL